MKAELENFIEKVDNDSKLKSELISLTERSIQSTTEERKQEVVNFAKSYGFKISVEDLDTVNEDLDINELKAEYL